jgi:hypothetical protein
MFGFDSLYSNSLDDEELARAAARERRVVLTRDRGLLKRRSVTHGYLVRSLDPHEQLAELIRRFDLAANVRLGSRCVDCNTSLVRVAKQDVLPQLPPAVARDYAEFSICPECRKVFWRGSHWQRMTELAVSLGIQKP